MSSKFRVVWICHFSNQEIMDILQPIPRGNMRAPWITLLAEIFEDQSDVELHIISPHSNINGSRRFVLRGVHYHFFSSTIPFSKNKFRGFGHCLAFFNRLTRFHFFKSKIQDIVTNINPDVIHLHGTENPYYSASVLGFKDVYPVLITIQGFISHSLQKNATTRSRTYYEKRIIKTFNHFGYRTKTMGKHIHELNPRAVLHWHWYPVRVAIAEPMEKEFDVVFFARITKDKGIEDLLRAVAIIREKKPSLRVRIIGGNCPRKLKNQYAYLENTVDWVGFIPTQDSLHQLASSAKISVLPTYHDIIPGTIIESMYLKLPVVSYDVGSIHEINDHQEIITLVKKGDVEGLANAILSLLNDEISQKEKADKGYKRAFEMFDNSNIYNDLMHAYRAVVSSFNG